MTGAVATALVTTVALTGCETTQERSARLAKLARHSIPTQKGLVITQTNRDVAVLSTDLLHDANGSAAVITLLNRSPRALAGVPIAITVRAPTGTALYQNDAPGLQSSLVSVPLLPPHGRATWVDDQVQASATTGTVTARLGPAQSTPAAPPRLAVSGVHLINDPANGIGAAADVVNDSPVTQQNLVVYGLARRGGRLVAAGRAVIPSLAARTSVPVQLFFIGNPSGAQLELTAPPSTLG